jgi:hypothetical protein
MSEQKETGGPAFGQVVELRCVRVDPNGATDWEPEAMLHGGLTVRDYFATKAPAPPKWWMDCYAKRTNDLDTHAAIITQWNYVYADSMLEARKK